MSQVTHFFNPNHDARGRFAAGSGTGGSFPGFSKTDQLKATQKLLMEASRLRPTLTPAEKIALEDYTETFQGSRAINLALQGKARHTIDQGGKPFTSDQQRQTTLASVRAMETLFDKTALNQTPLQLVRGIGKVGKDWGKPGSLTGQNLTSAALTSTTTDLNYAAYAAKTAAGLRGQKTGGSVLMVLHVPEKTVRALPASDVLHAQKKGVRPRPGHEVILPPGTQVKVISDVANTDRFMNEGGKVFDRIVRVEVLPEDPNYRQNLSFRDNLSGVLETVSHFFNPHHDARGRFTSGPGGGGKGIKLTGKFGNDEVDRMLADIKAKKLAYQSGPVGKLRDATDPGKFSKPELDAMKFYEGDFERSKVINDIYRRGDYKVHPVNLAGVTREAIFTHAAALKLAFNNAPALTEPVTLYRTIREIPKAWTARPSVMGATIKDPGFMSTTSKKGDADYYLNHVQKRKFKDGPELRPPAQLILTAPTGAKALSIDKLVPGALTEELLLPPGTSFKVTKDITNDSGLRQIYGTIVPISPSELAAAITEFYNPNHDDRGRFATGPHNSILKPDGGFTFDPVKGRMATKGFAVSPFPERSKVIDVDNMPVKQIRQAITAYATENMDIVEKDGYFIGGWRDPQPGGKVYLDVSIVTKTADEARKLSLKHDQIAFFDFGTGQSVQVNAGAKSGQGP